MSRKRCGTCSRWMWVCEDRCVADQLGGADASGHRTFLMLALVLA